MERLRLNGRVYVSEMAVQFKITEETVRRDLEKLEAEGILIRIYGGAVPHGKTAEDLPFNTRVIENDIAKRSIAVAAATLVSDNSTLMIDASTTCLLILERLKGKNGITIITNSAKIPCDYAGCGFEIVSTGGQLRDRSLAYTGESTRKALAQYYPDIVFLSCKALSADKGIMESNEPESELKKCMVQQGGKIVLLADHGKFGKTAFVKMLEFVDINCLITDLEPGPEWRALLGKKGIELILSEN